MSDAVEGALKVADVKWIKLTTDMFDNRKIKHLRKLPEGNNVVLIWVMLLTMAGRCNSNGMIFLTENIPYTPKMLADELDFEENTVQLALQSLKQFNMIVTDGDYFTIAGWEEYQNTDRLSQIREYNRIAQQKSRAKRKLLQGKTDDVNDKSMTSQRCHDTDIEEDKDRDKEVEKKSKKENTRALFERLLLEYNLPEMLQAKMGEWITYKIERKEQYQEQGMRTLLRKVENNLQTYGEQAMCDLIDDCMASGWKGIIFDRLAEKKKAMPQQQRGSFDTDAAFKKAMRRSYGDLEMHKSENPKTAADDESIRKRADDLKAAFAKGV